MNVLVRFKGGCGGEAVVRLISKHLDGQVKDLSVDPRNRAGSGRVDLFEYEMLHETITVAQSEAFGLPLGPWEAMTAEQIRTYVDGMRQLWPDHRVGMCHYNFSWDLDWRAAFGPDTVFIDILPDDGNFWLIQLLQLFKGALRKTKHLPSDRDNARYPSYDIMVQHHAEHGWIPHWWLSDCVPIGSFSEFLDNRGYPDKQRREKLRLTSNLMLDGGQLVSDRSLRGFEQILHIVGAGSLDDSDRINLENWAAGNLRIIDQLGATGYIGMAMTKAEQKQLIKDILLPQYDQLMARPDAWF